MSRYTTDRRNKQFTQEELLEALAMTKCGYVKLQVENQLVEWILECSKKGFPPRRDDIQAGAKWILDKSNLPSPFNNNIPGDGWFKGFLKRYPVLEEALSKSYLTSTVGDESSVREWFANIENYLKEKGLFDILEDPSRIYNCDETGFLVCAQRMNILGFKNSSEKNSTYQSNLNILSTVSASGSVPPPFIVYPDVTTKKRIPGPVPPGWCTEKSYNGYMTPELIIIYLKKILYPHLQKNKITFPVILFVNGRASHITLKVTEVCKKLKIILICLHQNLPMIVQHEAIEAFQFKRKLWANAVKQMRKENSNINIGLEHAISILKTVYQQTLPEKEAFARGFRELGLFPWNVNGVKYIKSSSTKSKQVPAEQQSTSHNNITLKFNDFVDIVGDDMIKDFEQNTDKMVSTRTAEELRGKLYQLYKKFMSYRENESEVMEWNSAQVQIKYEDDLSD